MAVYIASIFFLAAYWAEYVSLEHNDAMHLITWATIWLCTARILRDEKE